MAEFFNFLILKNSKGSHFFYHNSSDYKNKQQ